MINEITDKLRNTLDNNQINKLRKILDKVYFYSIATTGADQNSQPQATMVQPILTEDWQIFFISEKSTKKVRNLKANPKSWMIADATGLFNIPKVVYIKGETTVETLTQETFDWFLSNHGPISRRILSNLVEDKLDETALVTVNPTKFITVGIFGGFDEPISVEV